MFRVLPDQPHKRPQARRRSPPNNLIEEPNAPPSGSAAPPAAGSRLYLCAGRPNRSPPPLPPEIRRAPLDRSLRTRSAEPAAPPLPHRAAAGRPPAQLRRRLDGKPPPGGYGGGRDRPPAVIFGAVASVSGADDALHNPAFEPPARLPAPDSSSTKPAPARPRPRFAARRRTVEPIQPETTRVSLVRAARAALARSRPPQRGRGPAPANSPFTASNEIQPERRGHHHCR